MAYIWSFLFAWIIVIFLCMMKDIESKTCPPIPPTDVRAGCPGIDKTIDEGTCTTKTCCWHESPTNSAYPSCYYVPNNTMYNAALGKPTNQSSTFQTYKSSNAVDGCVRTYGDCCSDTTIESTTGPWWSVDLQKPLTVLSVTFASSIFDYLSNFIIKGSNTSGNPTTAHDLIDCVHYEETVPAKTTEKISCTNSINARYVIVQKLPGSDISLYMCEVKVEVAGRFNAAFGKHTWQSSVLSLKNFDPRPYKAVDGCLDNDWEHGCCIHTKTNRHPETYNNPWWAVDLGAQYKIYSVTLVNRGNEHRRLENLRIMVSNTTHIPGDRICANHSHQIPQGTALSIVCSAITRYVTVQKLNDHELNMCEVEVEADCRYNKYGASCLYDCYCRNNKSCDSITGMCPHGACMAGYGGQQCNTVCTDGFYGENCINECSGNCRYDSFCNLVTGECELCKDGYTGQKCDKECPAKTYGNNCTNICSANCTNQQCDKVTGDCNEGCIAGLMGPLCDTFCTAGSYGENCLNQCSGNCKDNLFCDPITGQCPLGLCKVGYIGQKCDNECPAKTYGNNCTNICSANCTNQQCDKVTGDCNEGCIAGLMGPLCDTSCSVGKYGENCAQTCSGHCKDGATCSITTGYCPQSMCQDGFTGLRCDTKIGSIIGGIVGGVVAVIVIIIVILLLLFILRKRRKKNDKRNNTYNSVTYKNKHNNNKSDTDLEIKTNSTANNLNEEEFAGPTACTSDKDVQNHVGQSTTVYQNIAEPTPEEQSKTLIKTTDIGSVLRKMASTNAFETEYESIPKVLFSIEEANDSELKPKNRYKNILPYDNNKVTLKKIAGDPLSQYINASYVKDLHGQRAYIAALGTTELTVTDFWRMIWEQNVEIIIMVTNLMEDNKTKCIQYWPYNATISKIGDNDVRVIVENEDVLPDFTIRTFEVTKADDTRQVIQYQYTRWPDKGVPENISGMCKVIQVMKKHRKKQHSPLLVHCSAGVGRTGTIIALDILLDQAEAEGVVDVYNCVYKLREQRAHMVQTQDQYKFIHYFLYEVLTVGSTAIPGSQFSTFLATGMEKINKQYQLLETIKPTINQSELDFGKVENKDQNRDIKVIPADGQRMKLSSFPEIYINAVYVEGYRRKREYCATQVPLKKSANNFWKLMFEEECTSIVCLQQDEKYIKWFPKEDSPISFGGYKIHTDQVKKVGCITQYLVTMKTNDITGTEYANVMNTSPNVSHVIKLFMIEGKIEDSTTLIDLYGAVQRWQQQNNNKLITVICLNGAEKTGMYIALSQLFDMANIEQEVDVYHVVKQIRKSRPQFISSQKQYVFIHEVIQKYIAGFEEYSNFK